MIDREFRDQAGLAVRRFLDCTIDNNDFQLEYPLKPSDDPVIRAIQEYVWHWYDDLSVHKLIKDHALSDDEREIGERCVLILRSDVEYEWRESKFISSALFSLGFASQLALSEQLALYLNQPEGDASVWPFFRRSDYELALNSNFPE